jgi:tetratricopeptide (TPR) repeat protein
VTVLVLLASVGPAEAQTREQQQQWCTGTDPDLAIGGCTAMIQTAHVSPWNLAVSLYNRGSAYGKKEQYDRAIADFDQAIRLQPDYALAFSNRCSSEFMLDRLTAAKASCDEGVRLAPNLAGAWDIRAWVALKGGKVASWGIKP